MLADHQVRATVQASLPGTDIVETLTVLRGELGAPHRGVLPVLAARSDVAHPIPRTTAVLTDLWCDLQPHGWRLVRHDGNEARSARALLASDVNALADVVGAESDGDRGPVTVELLGPVSLAAGLHLHNGERVLQDHGARRDLADSLADGLRVHLRSVRDSLDGREVILRIDEPALLRAADGLVPTASGYRTLRAVPRPEITAALATVAESARAAGASGVELVLPLGAGLRDHGDGTFDTLLFKAPGPAAEDWEPVAAVVENGLRVGLLLETQPPSGTSKGPLSVRLVESVARPWTQVGLPARLLTRTMVAPGPGLERSTPEELRRALSLTTDVARGLQRTALEA